MIYLRLIYLYIHGYDIYGRYIYICIHMTWAAGAFSIQCTMESTSTPTVAASASCTYCMRAGLGRISRVSRAYLARIAGVSRHLALALRAIAFKR